MFDTPYCGNPLLLQVPDRQKQHLVRKRKVQVKEIEQRCTSNRTVERKKLLTYIF